MKLQGSYHDPKKSGSGFFFTTTPGGTVAGAWFGHNNDGRNFWLTFSAQLSPGETEFSCPVYNTKSGKFPVAKKQETTSVGNLVVQSNNGKLKAILNVQTTALRALHPSPVPPPNHMTKAEFDLELLVGP